MSDTQKIDANEIEIGEMLAWHIYDSGGLLLLNKGSIIQSEQQLSVLLKRGLYRITKDLPANDSNPSVDNSSPFDHIADYSVRLDGIFKSIIDKDQDSEIRVTFLSHDIQTLCKKDPDALIGAVHLYNDLEYVLIHPIQTAILAEIFATSLEIAEEQRLSMMCGALTANISILELQTTLQSQNGPMTKEQKAEMQTHPLRSAQILRDVAISDLNWLNTVEQHHERIDGQGYGLDLVDHEIVDAAKIVGLCDIYSAMVVEKAYRDAHLANDILRVLFLSKGKEHDETLCLKLIKEMGVFPPGSFVKLVNGETAVVTHRAKEGSMWPMVTSIISREGKTYANPLSRDCNHEQYKIKEMCSMDKDIPLNLQLIWKYI